MPHGSMASLAGTLGYPYSFWRLITVLQLGALVPLPALHAVQCSWRAGPLACSVKSMRWKTLRVVEMFVSHSYTTLISIFYARAESSSLSWQVDIYVAVPSSLHYCTPHACIVTHGTQGWQLHSLCSGVKLTSLCRLALELPSSAYIMLSVDGAKASLSFSGV